MLNRPETKIHLCALLLRALLAGAADVAELRTSSIGVLLQQMLSSTVELWVNGHPDTSSSLHPSTPCLPTTRCANTRPLSDRMCAAIVCTMPTLPCSSIHLSSGTATSSQRRGRRQQRASALNVYTQSRRHRSIATLRPRARRCLPTVPRQTCCSTPHGNAYLSRPASRPALRWNLPGSCSTSSRSIGRHRGRPPPTSRRLKWRPNFANSYTRWCCGPLWPRRRRPSTHRRSRLWNLATQRRGRWFLWSGGTQRRGRQLLQSDRKQRWYNRAVPPAYGFPHIGLSLSAGGWRGRGYRDTDWRGSSSTVQL